MKYERLTNRCEPFYGFEKCKTCEYGKDGCDNWCDQITGCFCRLQEIEDKIESGELCDREEVKKETAKEILDKVYESVESARLNSEYQDKKRKWVIDEYEFMSEFTLGALHNLYKKYGIELFGKTEQVGNSDKLEDEE